MQQIKLRRLPASHQTCFYGAKGPAKPVPRLINAPFESQMSRKIVQRICREVFPALNAVRAETELPIESCSLFLQHLLSTLLPAIEWRVRDNQVPASSQASQRFLKSAPVVYGVVKRCVEDHHIELCEHERKAIHFGPEAQEWRYKVEIMPGCAETACVITQQADRHRSMHTLC